MRVLQIHGESPWTNFFQGTDLAEKSVSTFTEIFNGIYGNKLTLNLKNIVRYAMHNTSILLIDEDNNIYDLTSGVIKQITFGDSDNSMEKLSVTSLYGMLIRRNSSNEREFWVYTRRINESDFWGYGKIGGGFRNLTEEISKILDIDKIKDIYMMTYNAFILMENGKVYCFGNNLGSGVGKNTGELASFTCINDSNMFNKNITSFVYGNNLCSIGCFMLKDDSDNVYNTGNPSIMFGEKIFQKGWKKIASNVKTFNASTYSNCIAYIDNNDDIWVAGENSQILGANTENIEKISNFTLLKDYLKNDEVYSLIDGNVRDYRFDELSFYILTKDNNLYCSGTYGTGWNGQSSGLGNNVKAIKPTKILENVKDLYVGRAFKYAITLDNKFFAWGGNDRNQLIGGKKVVPTEVIFEEFEVSEIKDIFAASAYTGILLKDNSYYIIGSFSPDNADMNGLTETATVLTKYPVENYLGNEKIKSMAFILRNSKIFLTESGKLYGFGVKNLLGIDSMSNDYIYEPEILKVKGEEFKDVKSIVAGNGFYIAIKSDGTVWGTGTNVNGILGRWIGIDRNSPNSRYKTAFEWVECPELEI